MAHELSMRKNGTAEMAYVGQMPWHDLGQSLTKGASIGVWAKEAGLDWSAEEASVQFNIPDGTHWVNGQEFPSYEEHPASGYKMLYRSDTHAQLAVVGEDYKVVQPIDILEFFRDMTETQGWWIHTAGVLRGGRKLWAMATNDDISQVGKGDSVERHMLLATSLDGSMKTIGKETTVRVVCANTLAMAMRDTRGKKYAEVSHRTEFDADLMKRALGINQDHFAKFMKAAKELADTPVSTTEARELLRKIFKEDTKPAVPGLAWLGDLSKLDMVQEDKDSRPMTRVLELFQTEGMGSGLKSAKGTRWGLLNALTEYVDHEQGRSQDTRLDNAWFGRGDALKQDSFDIIAA